MNMNFVPVELRTGVDAMDGQHEHLFGQMAQVKEAFLADVPDHEAGLVLMSRLVKDLDEHFHWEEQEARERGIAFESHTREHAKIGAFVHAKIAEIKDGECNIPALMVFMERCFENHVLHHDLKLGRALLPADAVH